MRGDGSAVSLTCLRFVGKTKRLYVAARSRGVPTARRKLLSKVWTNVDADGSGTLDRDEVKSVLLRMGRKEESIDIDAVMADIDGDGSGDIDFREFTEWFLRMEMDELREIEDALMYHEIVEQAELDDEEEKVARAAEEEHQRQLHSRLKGVWNEVDKDGSGELNAGELKVVLLRMGRQDDIAGVMKQLDRDNSGGVDFHEFCAWFNEMDQAQLKVLEDAMQKAKEETAAKVGMESLCFVSKLKKVQRRNRKQAFLAHNSLDGDGFEHNDSVFKKVKKDKQIEIARTQLTDARSVADFHMLSAALRRARRVAYMHDEPILHAFCDSFEQELDPDSRLKINLHNSEVIKEEIVRFWDLMAFASETLDPVDEHAYWHRARANALHLKNKVSREGYTALHIRISKSVHDVSQHGKWKRKTAIESAQTDWFDDVARFSGDAGISAWYAKVRQAFQKEARISVTRMGWTALFKTFDTDGSGSLEVHEFIDAVRSTGIDDDTISIMEIRQLFRHVDADRSGEVDGAEFAQWLIQMEEQIERDANSGAHISGWQAVIAEFVKKCDARVMQMGWGAIFQKHDDDGNGQLDQYEFIQAVRTECPKLDIGDGELEEMFGIIDGDGGGSISGEEFFTGLGMETDDTNNMTFDVFSHSMLELADYWSLERSESGYVQFLRAVFRGITTRNPSTIPKGAATINGHPKDDVPVMWKTNAHVLLKELSRQPVHKLKQRAYAVGVEEELILVACATPTMEEQKEALTDLIVAKEMEGGHRPNYMLRDVKSVAPVVTSGAFIDPYAAQLDDEYGAEKMKAVKVGSTIPRATRIQRQCNMMPDTRRLYPVRRVQGRIVKPFDHEPQEQGEQSAQHVHATLNPWASELLTQGYSSVPHSPRARERASPERHRMIQTTSLVSSMTLPFSGGIGSRPSTASVSVQHKPFFAADQGKWYFASPAPGDRTIPVWAHLRSGTDAAYCEFPSWVCRPKRALHGYLVFVDNNQAALAIQRTIRGWLTRRASRRLQEEEKYFALLDQDTKNAKAARRIQAQFRAHTHRVIFLAMKASAVWIQAMVRGWLSRRNGLRKTISVVGTVQAGALANLRSRYAELGDEGILDVTDLSQLLTEIGLSSHVVTNAQNLLSAGSEASAAYSFDDACALLAAVDARSSQNDVLSDQQSVQQAIAIREALRTSCILTEHELGDASGGKEVEEEELTRLLQLLHKPAELRSDKDLELLDRRWACGYSWFQELASEMRREMCRYLRGGLLAATEPIYLVGEPLTAVFFVARGRVQLHPGGSEVATHDGDHRPSRTVGPGEGFGLPSSAVRDAGSMDWLGHERRTEVAEAEKGTVLLALGIEQWAWTLAERAACERAMIIRLLRSTALFANVSVEAHAALAAAMQCNALRFKEGETLVKQGDRRAERLCLLTSGQVKMTVAVRDQVLHRGGGGQSVDAATKETKIDVGIFNARGEITGETTLLDPHDSENNWKAEASLVAYQGPIRGFAVNADELRRLLIGHCHPALSDLSVAAHHLATERKIMIWQRLRGVEIGASASEMAAGANVVLTLADHILAQLNHVANHLSPSGKGKRRRDTRSQPSSAESIGIRTSYNGSTVSPEQFAAAVLRESVSGSSYMLGGHHRPQRVVSSLAGVPRTEAMDLDAYVYDAATVVLPARGHHVMSARLSSSTRTPELPRLEGTLRAQTARPSVDASERMRALHNKFAPKLVSKADADAPGGRRSSTRLGDVRPVGWGFATVPSIRGELGTPTWRSPRFARGGVGAQKRGGNHVGGKNSKGIGQHSKRLVPVPPSADRHMSKLLRHSNRTDPNSVKVVPMFGMRKQVTT